MAADYAVGYILYEGQPLTQVSEIDFEEESNDKAVDTILLGRAGYSSGAEACKVTIKSAIPRAGYEKNFHRTCRLHQTVQVRFRLAGVERTCEGRIMSVKSTTSVNNASALDVTIDGKVISEIAV